MTNLLQIRTNQSCTAGRELHFEVGKVIEDRFVIRFSKFDVPILGEIEPMMKNAHTPWVPIYIHVKTSVIRNIHFDISQFTTSAWTAHQIAENQIIAADKEVTT